MFTIFLKNAMALEKMFYFLLLCSSLTCQEYEHTWLILLSWSYLICQKFSSLFITLLFQFALSLLILYMFKYFLFRVSQHQLFLGTFMLVVTRVKSSKDLFKRINRVQARCRKHKFLLGQWGLSWSRKLQSAQDLGWANVRPLLAQLKRAGAKPEVLKCHRDSQVLNASPMIQEELEKLRPQDEGQFSILFLCCMCHRQKAQFNLLSLRCWVDYHQRLCSAWKQPNEPLWSFSLNCHVKIAARGMYQIYGFLQVDSKTEVGILAQYLEPMLQIIKLLVTEKAFPWNKVRNSHETSSSDWLRSFVPLDVLKG
jgi:hypothetical protein